MKRRSSKRRRPSGSLITRLGRRFFFRYARQSPRRAPLYRVHSRKPGSFAAIYTIRRESRHTLSDTFERLCTDTLPNARVLPRHVYTQCALCVRFRVRLAQEEAERYRGRATYVYDFRRCGTAGGKEIGECADTQGERERERTFPRFKKYMVGKRTKPIVTKQ